MPHDLIAGAGLRLPTLQELAGFAQLSQQLLRLKEEGNVAVKAG